MVLTSVRDLRNLRSVRDGFDDADGVEPRAPCHQRGLQARSGAEDEEAHLVLGNVDHALEADTRPPPRQLLGGQARPPLAPPALLDVAAGEEGLDEVAGRASTLRPKPTRRKRQNG
jgi:hypothetical protein